MFKFLKPALGLNKDPDVSSETIQQSRMPKSIGDLTILEDLLSDQKGRIDEQEKVALGKALTIVRRQKTEYSSISEWSNQTCKSELLTLLGEKDSNEDLTITIEQDAQGHSKVTGKIGKITLSRETSEILLKVTLKKINNVGDERLKIGSATLRRMVDADDGTCLCEVKALEHKVEILMTSRDKEDSIIGGSLSFDPTEPSQHFRISTLPNESAGVAWDNLSHRLRNALKSEQTTPRNAWSFSWS